MAYSFSGQATPEQQKVIVNLTKTNPAALPSYMQSIGAKNDASPSSGAPPSSAPISSHSAGSYTAPPPNSGVQSQIDDLRKQYDTTANPKVRETIHNQVAKLEASRGGVYNPGTGTYSFPNQQAQPAFTPPDTNAIEESIRTSYMNDLAAQTQAINQQLAQAIQASNLAVGQNKQMLDEQIKKLEQQKQINDQNAITLQNRRGGFYSGGLDYQLGNIASANTQAQEGITRDINARNADIYGRNALLAQQAEQNIGMLQSQAPDKIRSLVQQAIQQQQDNARADAALTGVYNGSPTLAAKNQEFNQNLDLNKFNYGLLTDQRNFEYQKQQDALAQKNLQEEKAYRQQRDSQEDKKWFANYQQNGQQFAQRLGLDWANLTQRQQENTADEAYRQKQLELQQEKFNLEQQQANQPQVSEPGKNDITSTYVSNIDRMTQDKRKKLFKDEKANIIKDIGVTGYNQLYDMYFDQYGQPKE